jgi:hypothetical protein
MDDFDDQVREAVRHFWATRDRQSERQGTASGVRDAGLRSAVTGGKHLDGFVTVCRKIITDAGLPEAAIYWEKKRELPGYYRAEKNWDLLVVIDGVLLAVIEFKGQVGPSFGNNFNNRTEEVVGNATDLWAAYREGAFQPSQRPWLGYVFLLEECPKSMAPVSVKEPHYKVFPEFVNASYAKRYELLLLRLIRERLYDSASLILAKREEAAEGAFRCPSEELSFLKFATSLSGHATAFAKMRQ